MPTTRAMARKAPTVSEETDDRTSGALRKKPVRRATAKVAANTTSEKPAKRASRTAQKAQPLSPKKITQIAKAASNAEANPSLKFDDNEHNTSGGRLAVQVSTAGKPSRTNPGRPTRLNSKPRAAPLTVQTQKATEEEPLPLCQHDNTPNPAPCKTVAQIEHGENNRIQNADRNTIQNLSPPEVPSQNMPVRSPGSTCTRRRPDIVLDLPERPRFDDITRGPATFEGSEDELCGAKTPLTRKRSTRRSVKPVHTCNDSDSDQSEVKSHTSYKTPARRPVTPHPPQTQKVPIKAPGLASAQRPMSVNRGSSMAYVFHPLPKPQRTTSQPGRVSSPIKFPYQWPVTPSDEEGNPIEVQAEKDQPVSSRPNLTRSKTIDPAQLSSGRRRHHRQPQLDDHRIPLAGRRLLELFQSDFDSDEDEDDDSDSDSDDESFAADIVDDSAVSQNLPAGVSSLDIDLQSDTDVEDDSVLQPELQDELLQSSPAPTAPAMHDDCLQDSQMSPATPSKPTLASSRLSNDATTDASDSDDGAQAQTTPRAEQNGFASEMASFKTPHMRSALEGFERRSSICDMVVPQENTICIDPSILGQTDPIFDFALTQCLSKTNGHDPVLAAEEDRLSHTTEKSPSKSAQYQDPRLSFFIHTDELCGDDEEQGIHNNTRNDSAAGLKLGDIETADIDEQREFEAQPDDTNLPHYAMATIASDARRQSMPVTTTPRTPQNLAFRPRTADTVVRPGVHDSFARMWLDKQTGSLGNRRNTVGLTEETPKARFTSTPLARSTSRISLRGKISSHELRQSINNVRRNPFVQAATPRPRCYTPTLRFARPATPSRSPVRSPVKLAARSPTKSTRRSPAKCASPVKLSSRTPMKTPLKPAGTTPAAVMFTPHPKQPLRSVIALVEVFTLDGSDASRSFVASLQRLGAKTTKTWSDRVTHVIFKEGSPATLQKIRLANKEAIEQESGKEIFCVNSRWVTDCDRQGSRMDEHAEEYAVDVFEIPRGGKKRRKSMEPSALHNMEGNIVPTPCGTAKKSLGYQKDNRLSLASTVWGESPIKGSYTPMVPGARGFDDEDDSWLETPVQAASEEDQYRVQQTMPVNRIRKFRLPELENTDRRRLTAWEMQD